MRNGFLESLPIFLVAASLTFAKPPGPIAQISFADDDQAVSTDGTVLRKVKPAPDDIQTPVPPLCGENLICSQPACGSPDRFWISAEYLLWWIRESNLPPLVTAGPAVVGGNAGGGILGQSGTVLLFGGGGLDNESFSGGRFTAGMWLNDCQTIGLEAGYFFLGSRSNHFNASSEGTTILARPIIDANFGIPSSEQAAVPGAAGRIEVSASSSLQGAELNGLCNICCSCNTRLDLLGGFRWLNLGEGLAIGENTTFLVPLGNNLPGDTLDVGDIFNTHNNFYGGQLGARAELRRGPIFVDLLGSVALGDTHQVVEISGATQTVSAGLATVNSGGLLALAGTNIGRFSRDQFSVVPELEINIGYQISARLRAFVGYTFLYWTDVARPGDQINLTVNPFRAPSIGPAFNPQALPAEPQFVFHNTDFWAQGISFGVEYRY